MKILRKSSDQERSRKGLPVVVEHLEVPDQERPEEAGLRRKAELAAARKRRREEREAAERDQEMDIDDVDVGTAEEEVVK